MGRDAITNSTTWSIGNGESISVREDKWLPSGVIGGPVKRNDPVFVTDRIDKNVPNWDEQTLRRLFDDRVVKEITSIPLLKENEADRMVWTGTKSGLYSVKNGYNQLKQDDLLSCIQQPSSSYQPPSKLWNKLWKLDVLPKLKMFLWSIC